jgi:hypothetical protein
MCSAPQKQLSQPESDKVTVIAEESAMQATSEGNSAEDVSVQEAGLLISVKSLRDRLFTY